jgi:hypothetical protein
LDAAGTPAFGHNAVHHLQCRDLSVRPCLPAVIVAIAADHTQELYFSRAVRRTLAAVPAGLTAALVAFIGYRALRLAVYEAGGSLGAAIAEKDDPYPEPRIDR